MTVVVLALVVLCSVMAAIAATVLFRVDRVDRAALQRVATARGWSLSDGGEPGRTEEIRLEPSGATWTLRVVRRLPRSAGDGPARSKGGLWTSWSAKSPALEAGLFAVKPGKPIPPQVMQMGAGFLQPLLERALTEMLGEDIGPITALHAMATGDARFDSKNAVITTDPALVSGMLNAAVRDALSAWSGPALVMLVSPAGLRLAIEGKALSDGQKFDALVALGDRVRSAIEQK